MLVPVEDSLECWCHVVPPPSGRGRAGTLKAPLSRVQEKVVSNIFVSYPLSGGVVTLRVAALFTVRSGHVHGTRFHIFQRRP